MNTITRENGSAQSIYPSSIIFCCNHFPSQYIRNPEGLYLYVRRWEVAEPVAVLFLAHGFAEHSGRYEHAARVFNAAGISVYTVDHQGHGLSDGDRAHVRLFRNLPRDFALFVAHEQARLDRAAIDKASATALAAGGATLSEADAAEAARRARKPSFLLGHSMGGLIALHVAVAQARSESDLVSVWPWAGLLLSGPAIALSPDMQNPVVIAAGRVLSLVLPKLPVQALDTSSLTRLAEVLRRHDRDPAVYTGAARARFGIEFLEGIKKARYVTVRILNHIRESYPFVFLIHSCAIFLTTHLFISLCPLFFYCLVPVCLRLRCLSLRSMARRTGSACPRARSSWSRPCPARTRHCSASRAPCTSCCTRRTGATLPTATLTGL